MISIERNCRKSRTNSPASSAKCGCNRAQSSNLECEEVYPGPLPDVVRPGLVSALHLSLELCSRHRMSSQ